MGRGKGGSWETVYFVTKVSLSDARNASPIQGIVDWRVEPEPKIVRGVLRVKTTSQNSGSSPSA